MRKIWPRIKVFVGVYVGLVASIWGVTEAYTYFTGDDLRIVLGAYWWLVFYVFPLVVAFFAMVVHRPKFDRAQSEFFNVKAREKIQEFGRSGEWDWHLLGQAIELYMDAIRCDPTHQHPHTNLAYVYHLVGENQKALEYLQKSLKLATSGPNYPGRNYKQVEAAIKTNSTLSSGRLIRPPMPAWFREKYKPFLG